MPGLLITLEGPEKAGKSTFFHNLQENFYKTHGIEPVFLFEPGGTSIGQQIRDVVHDMKNFDMDLRAEILLYTASRAQLVGQILKPKLAEGRVVIMDRYADSTRAYQGGGRELPNEDIEFLIQFATQGIKPDLTFLFDIDPEIALQRRNSTLEWNRMDDQNIEFHKRTMAAYRRMAAAEPQRWRVIDASQSIEQVYINIENQIVDKLKCSGFLEGNSYGPDRH